MIKADDKNTILITCARGLSPYLVNEIEELGFEISSQHETGAVIQASYNDCMKLNLELSTAFNVLWQVKNFECRDLDDLYREINRIGWHHYIDNDEYICVVSKTETEFINNTMFANQKVKDAIVDKIKAKTGSRPDAGPRRNNVVLNFYWKDDQAWIYINTSGNKLADRGYRKIPMRAPLQESLAAGIVKATEYDGSQVFVNPMCGSGTLAIEAALVALNRAPGLLRSNYGLMHTKLYDTDKWYDLRNDLSKKARKDLPKPIIATDISKDAIAAAKKNAKTAGVEHLIEFKVCDFAATPIPEGPGILVMNPEYGERLGDIEQLEHLYPEMGDFFKQECSGYNAFVFTGNLDLAKQVGLRSKRRIIFFNASIECRLLKYEIYQGTKRAKFQD